MSLNRSFSRRQFIQGAAAVGAIAPFILPSQVWGAEIAPSKKITVGFIGVGTQGRYLLGGFLGANQAQVVAVCDVDTTRREAAKKQVEEHYTVKKKIEYKGCDQYADFRQLL
jgi:threonine dehydrogenase-like Zn-dependent dehydrogenase